MRARPVVDYALPEAPEQVLARFARDLEHPAAPWVGSVGRQEVTLYLDDTRRRVWSPYLQLAVERTEEGSRVHGTMGPAPNLWTAFVFVYATQLTLFVAGAMYGSVQWSLGDTPTGLLAAALGLFGLASSCGLDLLGRRFAQAQMGLLRGAVMRSLPDARELDPTALGDR